MAVAGGKYSPIVCQSKQTIILYSSSRGFWSLDPPIVPSQPFLIRHVLSKHEGAVELMLFVALAGKPRINDRLHLANFVALFRTFWVPLAEVLEETCPVRGGHDEGLVEIRIAGEGPRDVGEKLFDSSLDDLDIHEGERCRSRERHVVRKHSDNVHDTKIEVVSARRARKGN